MPNAWPLARLGEVTINHDARRVPVRESNRKPGPYPYYGASGVVDYVDGYLFDGLHLLIAEDGENLRTRQTPIAFLADGQFWVNNHAHIVTGNDRADTRYLSYALAVTDISGYLTGSAMPKLSQKSMNAIELPLPPLDVQREIAAVLGALDDKIQQNRRTGRALEELVRATFKAWLVDFEPVKGKAAGEASFSGMSPDAFSALPDCLVESPIGAVPKGWGIASLPQLATFLNGLALQKYPARGDRSDLPVIKIAELRMGSCANADTANADVPVQYIINDGDLLFSWSGTLEVKRWFGGKGALNQHLFKVTPGCHPLWYVHHAILHHLPEFRAIASSKATTMGHIQRKHLEAALVAVPPESVFRTVDELIGPSYALTACLKAESRSLAMLRDYLLTKLLSGEVRVRPREGVHGV